MRRVALVTGARSPQAMGLETAELRLLAAVRAAANGTALDLRVVGARGARRYARRLGAAWVPAPPGRSSPLAWRGADLVHLVGLTVPPPRRTPFVATFHDLSPLHFDDEGELSPYATGIAARARLCLCPSAFTAGELERRLGVEPERIRVVPNGPGQSVSLETAPLADGELAALGLARPLVLRTGGYTARKNVPLLLEAWPKVRQATSVTLALVGPPQPARSRVLAAAPSRDGIAVLDYLEAGTLARLIRTADVVVSPSLYEGFGLPVLEAMAAGTPVVAVRTPFAEELCGDAGVLVEPDPAALADGVLRALGDEALRTRLRASGLRRASRFTWESSARRLLAAYAEASASRST